jgi:hypothetical protein
MLVDMLLNVFGRSVGLSTVPAGPEVTKKTLDDIKKSLVMTYQFIYGVSTSPYTAACAAIDAIGKVDDDLPMGDDAKMSPKNHLYFAPFDELKFFGGSIFDAVVRSPNFSPEQKKDLFFRMMDNGLDLPQLRSRGFMGVSYGLFPSDAPLPIANNSVLHMMAQEYGTDTDEYQGFSPFEAFMERFIVDEGSDKLLHFMKKYHIHVQETEPRLFNSGLVEHDLFQSMSGLGRIEMKAFCQRKGIGCPADVNVAWLDLAPSAPVARERGLGF